MTGIEFVKKIFDDPEMSDDSADAILWGCTGFPSFWHTNCPIKEMAYSLRHAKRAFARGFNMDQIYVGDDHFNPNRKKIMEVTHEQSNPNKHRHGYNLPIMR